jgi:hypothetical protein
MNEAFTERRSGFSNVPSIRWHQWVEELMKEDLPIELSRGSRRSSPQGTSRPFRARKEKGSTRDQAVRARGRSGGGAGRARERQLK